jgi:hypothetical protein
MAGAGQNIWRYVNSRPPLIFYAYLLMILSAHIFTRIHCPSLILSRGTYAFLLNPMKVHLLFFPSVPAAISATTTASASMSSASSSSTRCVVTTTTSTSASSSSTSYVVTTTTSTFASSSSTRCVATTSTTMSSASASSTTSSMAWR